VTWEGLKPPYSTIVADPPWPYAEGWPGWSMDREARRALPYSPMTLDEIAALPVAELAKPESYLFLWTTSRYLEDAYRLVRGWTFAPRQIVTWCKPPHGQGPGGMFATTTEFVLIAQRIGPKSHARGRRTNGYRADSSWFAWDRGVHSAKPPAFLDLVEQVSPGPYVELFARSPRLGWDSWGKGYESSVA
jgi:N6-adenosine-specific RNA methylase IME4